MTDYLFRGGLADLDPDLSEMTYLEAERQYRKLILIPSESTAPLAVRELLGSVFQNVYAEGYPDEETRWMSETEILDYPVRLGYFHRYADPRYYKGVEYIDIVESLARRRCAELFSANGFSADDIYVNVQPLSGAPANNAVYTALINPGDTILGMDLLHGGHLTHGSPASRSGKIYNAVHYTVDPTTEKINYDAVEELARQHKPKIIIAGYSSYPWAVDWKRFRSIADAVGAILMADIAHVAGLVVAGECLSPVGFAQVITFTTHKSLCGPRGACILTTDAALAKKLDRGVFPGEQGGPHVHAIAAMALTFKLDKTEQFKQLQRQIVKNCKSFTDRFIGRGLRIPYGGTDTHLMNLDCSTITGTDGTTLSGDQTARILDIAGMVVNRNTIPGDKSAADPNGIRMGSPWVTQKGFKEADMITLADIITDVMQATTPYSQEGRKGSTRRAKVDFNVLEEAKLRTRALSEKTGVDYQPTRHGYPHFYFMDDQPTGDWAAYEIRGEKARSFLNFALSSDVEALQPGETQPTCIYTPNGEAVGAMTCIGSHEFRLVVPAQKGGLVAAWLRDLSDGYVAFGDDPLRKLPGPVVVDEASVYETSKVERVPVIAQKPYYIGPALVPETPLPQFIWQDSGHEPVTLRRTPIYETHKALSAKIIPFAGWEMPVWYTSVMEEHLACRNAAGLFDVAHMGVYQAEGPDGMVFLDSVVGNDISTLEVGESCYTHFLDPDANVIDDLLVYRRGPEKYLVVVNASNDDKNWAWLNAVKEGRVRADNRHPCTRAYGRNVVLRNLRDPQESADMRVDIAIQGPKSREILLALGCDPANRKRIMKLNRTELCEAVAGGFDLVVSRTGYTGEKIAFELFVHPAKANELFKTLLKVGEPLGLKPCGLGARDSLRTEAGLPLYGHEMGTGSGQLGERDLGVAEAGFGSYVKTYKPWFIGREAFLQREVSRKGVVVRFRFNDKGVRMAHGGDPVIDRRSRVIGWVTSCAVDKEGLLTGQAYVELKNSEESTPVFIYQSAAKETGKAPADLMVGDRSLLPTPATVISRFQK
jgi:glycine hydroxymethyltransferase